MAQYKFTYAGLDQIKMDRDERSYYCSFKMFWKPTGELLSEIITSKDFNGRWVEDRGGYKQVAGTCQYRIPKSAMGVRKALKALAVENISLDLDNLISEYITENAVEIVFHDDGSVEHVENPNFAAAVEAAKDNPEYKARRAHLLELLEALQ